MTRTSFLDYVRDFSTTVEINSTRMVILTFISGFLLLSSCFGILSVLLIYAKVGL